MIREKKELEKELEKRLAIAVRSKDILISEYLYDEIAQIKIADGADVAEMVAFGVSKALTIHRIEKTLEVEENIVYN